MKPITLFCLTAATLLTRACSNPTLISTATPVQTVSSQPTSTPVMAASKPITPTATLVPFFGPRPADATGYDMLMRQYTKKTGNGETLLYSPKLSMWMELHSPPTGIFLIDHRIAFYQTPHDLLPLIVEADPALGWKQNLIHVDQSNIYTTPRLRLVSFSSTVETVLASQSDINLHQKDALREVNTLLDDIQRGSKSIQFRVPNDPREYTWIPTKGVKVWLVKDNILDPEDAAIYVLDNGDRVKIFAEDGVLQYIVGISSLNPGLQQDGLLAKILSPMFEVLLSARGKLPTKINNYYDRDHKFRSPGELSDMARPAIIDGTQTPGFILSVKREQSQ